LVGVQPKTPLQKLTALDFRSSTFKKKEKKTKKEKGGAKAGKEGQKRSTKKGQNP